jgi:YidC/Oxa1 family membrane protein insertase
MESQRLILFFVFSFSVFLLLDAWQREQAPPTPASIAEKGKDTEKGAKSAPGTAQVPAQVPSGSEKLAVPTAVPKAKTDAALPAAEKTIRVETDVLVADVSTRGGSVQRVEFKQHRDTLDKNKPFVLLSPEHSYAAQSGLTGGTLPNHFTVFAAEQDNYLLGEGADELVLRLRAPPVNGVEVTKVYRFRRGSYLVDVTFEIVNKTGEKIQPQVYAQLVRDSKPPAGDSAMVPTFTGFAVYTDKEKFHKITFEEIDKGKASYPKNSNDGWVAIVQHYFFSAWLPKNDGPRAFEILRLEDGRYAARVIVPAGVIEPGATGSVSVPLYAGPQEQRKLETIAPGLDLVVDYGWLTVIAVPLYWVLGWFHQWVGNWGVAIILLTIVIKLLFYPLSAASYRSMAKMRVVAPKMQRLKDQYGNDRQRLQQAMMELYKTEQINPLGGCMPIVIQIPVFIALYWVLLASVELRHAPFGLGVSDLTMDAITSVALGFPAAIPYFVLPILMGATMIIQTALNPEPPDPVQAKVMKIMPVVFSVFFFFFPAGLVLYWLVNNILSIAQQWHITRTLEREAAAATRKR